ncbi:hypothetical protein [Amycolatopsis anabasis]|uniref:hypothetical protein n=1 Tax=Amycolatopsis anabasis TaxID=1840409 RepID=UPI00131C69B8|nr:hypothetical protein [Amycolatopsis anabasis]
MLERLPDLAAPVTLATGPAYRVFNRTGEVVALPQRLLLDRQPDGRPVLLVTLVRGSGSPGATGGRLDLGLVVHTDFEAVSGELIDRDEHARLLDLEVDGGVLRVTGPEDFEATTVAGPELLARANLGTELGPVAAALAKRLTQEGLPPVDATLRLRVRAVSPRHPAAYTFDPRVVATDLAKRLGAGATVTVAGLAQTIEEVVPGARDAADPAGRGHALALRLLDLLSEPAPSVEPAHRLRPPTEVPRGEIRVDLAEPGAVAIDVVVRLDLGAAAAAIVAADPGTLVRQIDLPAFPTGRTPVSVAANLVTPVAGMARLLADVRVPARPPVRPQPVSASTELPAPGHTGEMVLALAPGETLDGECRLRALLDTGDGPEELPGPWRRVTSDRVLLGPDAFGLPMTVVRCSTGLTALATVDILAANGHQLGTLDAARPVAAVPVPAPDARPRLLLRPHGPGKPIEVELPARTRIDLDPATLPGFGSHQATFELGGSAGRTVVRWRPEGTDESVAREVVLDPSAPRVRLRWVATSPFQPGLLWRIDTPGSPWSEPVGPADELVITVAGAPIEIDGCQLRPDRGQPGVWTYLPPGPFVEREPSGKPTLSIVEAGEVAFLQLTTRLDLPEDARLRLTERLRQHLERADAEARAAAVVVETVALQIAGEEGGWATIASGGSSGLPPWTTALSVSLSATQLAALKAAIGGRIGLVRLHTRFAAPVEHQPSMTQIATAEVRYVSDQGPAEGVSLAVTGTTPTAAPAPRVVEQANDLADLINPG